MIFPRPQEDDIPPEEAPIHHRKHAWNVIHMYATRYPSIPSPEDEAQARAFIIQWIDDALSSDLPLGEVQEAHDNHPPDTSSKLALLRWTVHLHDRVNLIRGKAIWSASSKRHPLLTSMVSHADKSKSAKYRLALSRKPINKL